MPPYTPLFCSPQKPPSKKTNTLQCRSLNSWCMEPLFSYSTDLNGVAQAVWNSWLRDQSPWFITMFTHRRKARVWTAEVGYAHLMWTSVNQRLAYWFRKCHAHWGRHPVGMWLISVELSKRTEPFRMLKDCLIIFKHLFFLTSHKQPISSFHSLHLKPHWDLQYSSFFDSLKCMFKLSKVKFFTSRNNIYIILFLIEPELDLFSEEAAVLKIKPKLWIR